MMRILTQTDFSNNVNGIVDAAAATTTIATARATNSFVSVGPKTIQPVGATRISDKCRLPPTNTRNDAEPKHRPCSNDAGGGGGGVTTFRGNGLEDDWRKRTLACQ